ncbi:MAG: hypothetical protein QHG99_04985 [Methanomicrobiales archaeon]|nr:hypothetical protein [Methanomicrobiales archaeon]
MKLSYAILIISILVLLAAQPSIAGPQLMVTGTNVQPEVFMKGDTGTVTLMVKNNGDSGVQVNRATMYGGAFSVMSDPYPTVGWLGAGNSISFTFTIRAGNEDGIFYPRFVLELTDGTAIRHVIPVRVESSDLTISLVKKPDYITIGRTASYTLEIGNPRPNAVSGVQVIPEGQGFEVTPTRYFIGSLESDHTASVDFQVMPERISQMRFRVIFKNGVNEHQNSLLVPVVPSENKKAAEIHVTNLVSVQEGERFRLTGDVSNAGLERANSVVIRTEAPAVPVDPFRIYVVGSLEPDDFSSFELTFRTPRSTQIPIVVEYKDAEGNRIATTSYVDVTAAPLSEEGGIISKFGLVLVWLLVIVVVIVIVYSWRRR